MELQLGLQEQYFEWKGGMGTSTVGGAPGTLVLKIIMSLNTVFI